MKTILTLTVLCVFAFQLQAQVSFTNSSTPGVGNQPDSMTAADLNGDGKVELITANHADHTLSVLTNNGSGVYALAYTVNTGNGPSSVSAVDLNGDGRLDLLCANNADNTLSVLTNNGTGGFALASLSNVGSNPYSAIAVDVKGDGKLDLVCANYGLGSGNTLSVLTNNGSGAFGLASSPNVGSGPISVVATDINGDGKVDLICANIGSSTLSILTNNGSGGFVIASSPGVGSNPYAVTAADVNGDGKLDLITANRGNSTLSILTNNGSGGFILASSPSVGSAPQSVTAADVNGDGKVDLISANSVDNTLSVLTNNGSGDFTLVASPSGGNYPVWVVAADLNGDGKLDLVSLDYGNNALTVLLNATPFPVSTPNATGTAIISFGFVVSVSLNNGGYGYTNTPWVRLVGGGGSGAGATAVVSNGVVTGITITNTGSGYTSAPQVVIEPPFITNPVLNIAPMSFLIFSNLTLGGAYQLQRSASWYWINQPVNFTASNAIYTQMVPGVVGSGNYRLALNPVPAQAFATPVVDYGFVVHATITSGGSGYVTSPAVSIVGGGGTNATAVSQISGGVVTNIVITDPGTGYTSTPTIKIGQPPAAALSPTVLPVMRVDAAQLAPYDNYQIQFKPDLTAAWANWNGGLFSPTATTNSQYLFITNDVGFIRLLYVP